MERTEVYCDVCERKMSYVDSDGNEDISGITTEGDITIRQNYRTKSGSSGFPSQYLRGKHFCSKACLTKTVTEMLDGVVDYTLKII